MQNNVRWRSDRFWYICQSTWANKYLEPLVKWYLMQFRGPVLVQKPLFFIQMNYHFVAIPLTVTQLTWSSSLTILHLKKYAIIKYKSAGSQVYYGIHWFIILKYPGHLVEKNNLEWINQSLVVISSLTIYHTSLVIIIST